ncbi:MAG TPA: TonB-dependent receptor [Rhodanobacter sp.]|nr:TonB-dependent receptor [Rhodanobacter sp.]
MNTKKFNNKSRRSAVRRTVLAAAIAAGFGLSGQVMAQATTGTIFGSAPVAAGETVQITGGAGFNRTVPVDSTGHYSVTVPIGTYTVNLMQNGQVIQTKTDVSPTVSGATAVDFASAAAGENANAKNLTAVTVTANSIPAIDVTSTRQSLVITAEQLKHLPVARSGESIALLAPGTVEGARALGAGPTGQPMVSFGGASVAENAYYVNGFNSSDPLGNQGGVTLPYGSIAQQETLTSGYGAQYGRSAGGVISQIGKSGTNDWHFGAQALWTPAFARSSTDNILYANPLSKRPGKEVGDLYAYRQVNSSWETVYDAYVGGPLIKDKLFFFVSAEVDKTQATSNGSLSAARVDQQKFSDPKFYAKLDWNINDSNILSLTGIRNKHQFQGSEYLYNNTAHQTGAFDSYDPSTKNSFSIWIGKYTGYITDDLTVNAMYGKMTGVLYSAFPGTGSSPLPNITNPTQQNPALTGGNPNGITNAQTIAIVGNPGHQSSTTNLRLDLEWKLGRHDLQFGIDNQVTQDIGDGSLTTGPGYSWAYSNVGGYQVGNDPTKAPWVDDPANYPNGVGADGNTYSVGKTVFLTAATLSVKQHAQYIQDNWQVTDNLLLNIGVRNDEFTNYNAQAKPYLRLTHGQWAPRLGFSWDIFGDASLKVFGNAGRYYLALPTAVAVREASASTFTTQFYTYSGIDANGIPQGLTPINSKGQTSGPGVPVSANNEYGQALDPNTVHSTNIGAEYQDEFVLGMQQQINPSWVYGVQAMYRKLGRVIDDVADTAVECNQLIAQNQSKKAQLDAQGLAADSAYDPTNPCGTPADLGIQGSVLINPGSTNNFVVSNGAGGYNHFTVSPQQFGFPKATRKYYSLEAYLEHPFDGKWQGKLDYVFSKSYGSTEGPVQSNIGQGGSSVSITTQWDFGSLMEFSNGLQANNRKHVLKAFGSYQITPEWMVSGVLTLASGTPASCLGYYGPNETAGNAYAGFYHWCGGKGAPGGSTGSTPWIHQLNLSGEYRPEWAGKKLAFQLQVHNVFNEQNAVQLSPFYNTTASPNVNYRRPQFTEAPRYVQVGATYDW